MLSRKKLDVLRKYFKTHKFIGKACRDQVCIFLKQYRLEHYTTKTKFLQFAQMQSKFGINPNLGSILIPPPAFILKSRFPKWIEIADRRWCTLSPISQLQVVENLTFQVEFY